MLFNIFKVEGTNTFVVYLQHKITFSMTYVKSSDLFSFEKLLNGTLTFEDTEMEKRIKDQINQLH